MYRNNLLTITLLTLVTSLLGFTVASKFALAEASNAGSTTSIVYGFKEGDTKSIYVSDEHGQNRTQLVNATVSDGYPAVSPLGDKVAFYGKYDDYKTWSIHIVDLDGKNLRRLTHVKNVWDSAPAWSPDGSKIVFAREYKNTAGQWQEELWLMNNDGTEQRQIMGVAGRAPEFFPDGRLLFQSQAKPRQIVMANIDGSNQITLTDDDSDSMSPKLSPDGRHIAYLSNKDISQEVYIMNVDGSGQTRLTFNFIEEWGPAWSSDSSKIYFSSQNVHGFYDVYHVNKDGSSIEKILSNSSQAATFPFDSGGNQ